MEPAAWAGREVQCKFLSTLGGSTPRLRHIRLYDIAFSALPRNLRSSRDLVTLTLGPDLDGEVRSRFPLPETLVAALSEATQLKRLTLRPDHDKNHRIDKQSSDHSDPTNLIRLHTTLPNSTSGVAGINLEDFVSRIDAPIFEQLRVSFHREIGYIDDIPHLSAFISRTEKLTPLPHRILIEVWADAFTIRHWFKRPSSPMEDIRLELGCFGRSNP
ncbi:hypothetical protein F5148DRAFT_1158794 [Russula earlei]|uniref:Uncharacterized protein n=1 Tax=Russula earlei TaxID=71964 RepID=A0ACC0UQL6_9AGAM|nr:hypothetical protein F5148DRAFT_1158794 [Russula earlei]